MSEYHTPVLLTESVDLLQVDAAGVYVDLTFGGGGHSREILRRLGPEGRLYAFDQDPDARAGLPDDRRLVFVHNNFRFVRPCLRAEGVGRVDGILADLGVSSHHFDELERGFSFRGAAPLDMRMNRGAARSAREVVNGYPEQDLIRVLRDYGELEQPHRAARAIAAARAGREIVTTGELCAAVAALVPRGDEHKYLAKLFQAIRIEVNHEMEALRMMLEQALRVLRPGGRLVVITYHSLEDRIVKNYLRDGNFEGEAQKDFFGRKSAPFTLITRKAVVPPAEEIERNPRSRSAKLRAAEKKMED